MPALLLALLQNPQRHSHLPDVQTPLVMFSPELKHEIADAVQKILRATGHPELPETGEIRFHLHVDGAESWSWADIVNNGAVR
jgi:hypothetical protein